MLKNLSLFICLYSVAHSSHAVLVDSGSTTIDTDTGLEWLDLSLTGNMSYNSVQTELQPGGEFEGYRYATFDEVLQLWTGAGISDTGFTWVDNGEWDEVKALADMLGTTNLFDETGVGTHALGMVEGGPANNPNQRWVMELSYRNTGMDVRTSTTNYSLELDFADYHYSSYLVRTVPIPAAAWLFGSGLLGLAGVARRKARTS